MAQTQITAAEALEEVRRAFNRNVGLDMTGEVFEKANGNFSADFRCYDLFTDRSEDDDWAPMTGLDRAVEIVTAALKGTGWTLVSIAPSEKKWFDVEITGS